MDRDEQAIRQLIETWMTATMAGDAATVLGLMTDDVVFLVPGRPPMRGKSAFAASQNVIADVSIQADSEIQEVRVMGEWAYAWTALTVAMTPKNGSTAKRVGNTLSIFRKSAGGWLLFRDANMLATAPG